ncbi:3948_t:CDS:2, partial [Racocetra persica]
QSAAAAPSPTSAAANPPSSTNPPPSLSDLPVFNYSLTQKTPEERAALCAQNKNYCTTNCNNKAPMNFCNNQTMGWGCGCSDKVPDFQAYQWPINYADCIGKGEACKQSCGQTNFTCIQACSAYYSNRCGSPSQPPAYYNTTDENTPPSYAPPPTDSSSANGTSP